MSTQTKFNDMNSFSVLHVSNCPQLSAAVTTIAVILFGTSSWICVNAVWVEVPIMVNYLPEAWNLPSFLTVIVQIAVIGPLIYGIAEKLLGPRLRPSFIIYAMLTLGCIATLLLAQFWEVRTFVSGSGEHSVALFVLWFLLSLVDCSSNVLFLPYMSSFKAKYVTIYFIGMAFSGLVPSALALVQGAGHVVCNYNHSANHSRSVAIAVQPRFSVATFNWLMVLLMVLALGAFTFLDLSPLAETERKKTRNEHKQEQLDDYATAKTESMKNDGVVVNGAIGTQEKSMSNSQFLVLLGITAWICALMNGVLPSIQSYACLPYGQNSYHLAVTLSSMASPAATFVPLFYNLKSLPVMVALTVVVTALAGLIVIQAAGSPHPFLAGHMAGSVLTVFVWFSVRALLTYLRTVIAAHLNSNSGKSRALFWCGAATQLGSFIGAIALFPLVAIYHVFQSAPMC